MTTTAGFGVPADAADPVTPPDADAGELAGPAREQFAQSPAAQAGAATASTVPTGVDLYENNPWFADSTVSFMILKAFEYRADARFAARFPLVKSSGRLRGAYLFGHPSLDAGVQAGEFCKVLRDAGFSAGDRPWLDFEVTDGKSPSFCAGWAGEACAAVDAGLGLPHGTTGVYTYTDFIWQGNCAGLGSRPLWFARPAALGPWGGGVNLGPWAEPALVQYTVTSIDWDFYNGTAEQLTAFWGSAPPVPPVPPPATNWTVNLLSELPTLQAGSTGEDVKSVQGLLVARGYGVKADGAFGPATRSAVMSLQHAKGLPADGVCGIHTWTALLNR